MKILPDVCYSVSDMDDSVIIIERNVSGYYRANIPTRDRAEAETVTMERNAILEVSMAQRKAMEMGSMFGWFCPAATVEFWESKGI